MSIDLGEIALYINLGVHEATMQNQNLFAQYIEEWKER